MALAQIKRAPEWSVAGKRAILATMHGKERVIRPLLEGGLGLEVELPDGFDTDRFGKFSREVERKGSQLDAARAKIEAALGQDRQAQIAIASEGSFGPHPQFFFAPVGREIVVMRDRETGLEMIGRHADLSTNFAHETVETVEAAISFAERTGFPRHGLIVMGLSEGNPVSDRYLRKDVRTLAALSESVAEVLALCGVAHIETDMRAPQPDTDACDQAGHDRSRPCLSQPLP